MKFQTPYLPQDIQPCTWSQADMWSQVEVLPNSKNYYGSAEAIIKKTWFLELRKALNWYETRRPIGWGSGLKHVWLNHQHVIKCLIFTDLQRNCCHKCIYFRDSGRVSVNLSHLGLPLLSGICSGTSRPSCPSSENSGSCPHPGSLLRPSLFRPPNYFPHHFLPTPKL